MSREDVRARRLRRLLIAGFVAALLPLLPGELRYHGDERFYADGALHMLRTGDYLTPAYADGRPRFLKPGLSYWLIAASCKAFGANLAASRLPSLLAGAGALWLSGRTVLALGGSQSASLLAVALLASNMSLLLASMRSTPDALLCLFLSLSIFGFLRIAALGDRRPAAYALAYLGAGLAVAAKGFLGLLPVVFSFLFCALGRRRGAPSPAALVHLPAMAAGAAVGLGWFVAVLLQHGAVAWAGFFSDQIGGKVEASRVRALGNVPRYLLAALQHFLPWSALAAAAWLTGRRDAPAGDRREHLVGLFTLAFLSVMVLVFAAGRDMRPRYLLPAYPLLAVALAPWLERRFAGPRGSVLARWLRGVVAIAGVGGGLALAAAGLALHQRIAAAGLALAAGAALVVIASRGGWRHAVTGTALLLVLALPLHDLLVSPVFKTQPARLAAARVAALEPMPARVVLLGLGGEYAGLLSLHLQGRVAVVTATEAPSRDASGRTVVVATGRYRDGLLAGGYRLEDCGFLLRRRTLRELLSAGASASRPQDARIPVYLALGGAPPAP